MAKGQQECHGCHMMKTVEYRGKFDEFYCSKECATRNAINLVDFKCQCCGQDLPGKTGIFTTKTQIWCADGFYKLPKLFCSIECLMKDGGFLTAEEWDKENHNG